MHHFVTYDIYIKVSNTIVCCQVVETLEVTAWRADRVTETRVETGEPGAGASISPSQAEEASVPGQITQIIQNVLLNLLGGGGLLGMSGEKQV